MIKDINTQILALKLKQILDIRKPVEGPRKLDDLKVDS